MYKPQNHGGWSGRWGRPFILEEEGRHFIYLESGNVTGLRWEVLGGLEGGGDRISGGEVDSANQSQGKKT